MSGRFGSAVRPLAAVALVAAATVAVGLRPTGVSAAPPNIDGPTRLYMLPADNTGVIPDLLAGLAIPIGTMKFDDVPLGGDVISRQSRVITFESAETAQCNIHGTDGTGSTGSTSDDFSLTGCTAVQLGVSHGELSFNPAPAEEDDPRTPGAKIYRLPTGALVRDASTPDDLSGPAIALIGSTAELNNGIKTLVYTPSTDDSNTPGDQRDYYYHGSNPETLDILMAPGDPNLPSGTNSWDVDIKVLDYNNFPEMTLNPMTTWDVTSGGDVDMFDPGPDPLGDEPDVASVVVADEDNDDVIEDPNDGYIDGKGKQFLLAAWTTCGTFSIRREADFSIRDDLEAIFDEIWDRSVDSTSTPDTDKETVKDAFFEVLPDEVENLPFANENPDEPHKAFIGITNDIEDLNWALGHITFHAEDKLGTPVASGTTCKLRVLVSDLGNNGLPLQYFGDPNTGAELPMFGVDLDTNYVPAVEEFTINIDGGGPVTPTVISVSDVTLAEGTGGTTTPFTFTLTLDAPAPAGGATVDVQTLNGPAPVTDGTDLALFTSTVMFAEGATSGAATVPVNHDPDVEPDEHFTLLLGPATGVTIGDPSGLGTVQNDDGPDAPPQVTAFTAQSKNEGTGAGTTTYDFTITLSEAAPAGGAAVRFSTSHGTTDDTDLTTTAGQIVVFSEGQTARTVSIQTNRDATPEANETFMATLSNPQGVTIAATAQTAAATIVNDDLNTVSISDESVVEGDPPGTVDMIFDLNLSGPAVGNESVLVTTGGGTASPVVDYAPLMAVPVTFNAGSTSSQVTVTVNGDDFDENNETFIAVLNNPLNLAITDGFGTGTILDDDTLTVSVADVTMAEGNAGTTNFVFTLALNGPAPAGTSVTVATADGSATDGPLPDDYTAVNQIVSFVTGAQSATVTVPVHGDMTDEPDETFTLTLSNPVNVAIADGEATGTIQNDDGAEVDETVMINDVTMDEGDIGTTLFTFTLGLSDPAEGGEAVTATVTHDSTDDTDLMLPAPVMVTFNATDTSATVTVPVNGDLVLENDETFNVTLSAPQGLLIGDMAGVGTVTNDDEPKHVTAISDPTLAEGNSGTTSFVFTLTLDGPAGDLESVVATTTHGAVGLDPTNDTDFLDGVVPVVFTPGLSTATVTVLGLTDVVPEPDEGFTLTLSNPQNLVLDDTTATGTVQNDDGPMAPPQIVSVSDVATLEGNGGTTPFVFTLTLNEPASGDESVDVSTAHGPLPPTDGADLTPLVAQTVTFAPMATSATVTVLVNGDPDVEADENFTVMLSNPQNVTIAAAAQSATGTVVNDDVVVQPPSPLTITVPADITVPNDQGQPGAIVNYPAPTTNGGVPPVTVTCSSPSGGFYPIGVTTVTCTATDSDPNPQQQLALAIASDSFTITVVDTTPPSTTTPPDSTAPPVTPPVTPPPSTNNTAPDVGQLPATGGNSRTPLGIAIVTCLAGIALLGVRRRSRPAA